MPFCKNCGSFIPDSSAFCSSCGTAVNSDAPAAAPETTPVVDVPAPAAQPAYNSYNQQPNYDYNQQPGYGYDYNQQPGYGYEQPGYSTPVVPELPVGAKVTSIIAMVCGIVSCCTCYVGFAFSIAALVLAGISLGQTPPGVSNGKAVAGRATGIVGIVLSVISIIVLASM